MELVEQDFFPDRFTAYGLIVPGKGSEHFQHAHADFSLLILALDGSDRGVGTAMKLEVKLAAITGQLAAGGSILFQAAQVVGCAAEF